MVLQDKKQMAFLAACGLIVVGLLIACLLFRHGAIPIIFGIIFAGVGTLMLFKIRKVTIELDRATGTIHILLQGLKSKEERNLGMAQIQKILLRKMIEVHTTRTSGGHFRGNTTATSSTTTYHRFILVFVTDRNEQISFDFGRVKVGLMNMLTHPEEKIRQNAQQVATFLNVPLDAANPSASDVLGAIREGLAGRLQKVH
jgi:hypothetical protein